MLLIAKEAPLRPTISVYISSHFASIAFKMEAGIKEKTAP
ncbi:hypothetical protein QE422_000130 [Chryseobacterium sp. SORGH_AS 447]|nr:hypothetical protein [Chryseobacterium sp. SORGH_AS_0447]